MAKSFYLRLAATNLRNNKSTYFPYIFSCSTIVGLYYILHATAQITGSGQFTGAAHVSLILSLSCVIAAVISVIIVFYTNSFLIKRRKKELGLYSVLGMEKRHVAGVLFCEVAITGLFCLAAGIAGGILLNQLMYLLLLNILHMPVIMSFSVPVSSIFLTLSLFSFTFLLVMLYNFRQIHVANPIVLLQAGSQGEREPRAKWLIAVLGALILGSGYAIALGVKNASDAFTMFFPAVLLVIIGTYLIFTAGSIAFLKLLRRNKTFYYKPQNFISVSGMIYRMKQNAVGLSNICILSTCLLVTLSSTLSLYLGEEDILRKRFPRDVLTSCIVESGISAKQLEDAANRHAKLHGLDIENAVGHHSISMNAVLRDGVMDGNIPDFSAQGVIYAIEIILLEEYNRDQDQNYTLGPGEVLVSGSPVGDDGKLILGQDAYRVAAQVRMPQYVEGNIYNTLAIVARDLDSMREVQSSIFSNGENQRPLYYQYDFDLSGEEEAIQGFCNSLRDGLNETVPRLSRIQDIFTSRQDFFSTYGSLMFVGIFFVALFLIATVLIIYYKQISEGYEDHDRFQIMQKVGLSQREVRKTIQQQVLIVFFLPLIVAIVHISMAFPSLCKLLLLFGMDHTMLFVWCAVGSVLAFAVIYFAVYQITSRTYYKLVQSQIQ